MKKLGFRVPPYSRFWISSLNWIIIIFLLGRSCATLGPEKFVRGDMVHVSSGEKGFKCEKDSNGNAPFKVGFYRLSDRPANETDLVLREDICYVIPRSAQNPHFDSNSITIYGNASTCLEVHSESNCGGESDLFRLAYPSGHRNNLSNVGLVIDFTINYGRAVSLCGDFCKKTIPEINTVLEENPGQDVVTLYRDLGYYGHPTHVNLSAGCITLGDELKLLAVIRTYGKCVILYAMPNCSEKNGAYSYQTSGKSLEYYVEKITTLTIPLVPRSLQLCPEENNVEELPRGEHGDMDICEEFPSLRNVPAWVLIYVGLCIATLSAVGGSYFTKFVLKKKKIGRNLGVELANVQYKADDQ